MFLLFCSASCASSHHSEHHVWIQSTHCMKHNTCTTKPTDTHTVVQQQFTKTRSLIYSLCAFTFKRFPQCMLGTSLSVRSSSSCFLIVTLHQTACSDPRLYITMDARGVTLVFRDAAYVRHHHVHLEAGPSIKERRMFPFTLWKQMLLAQTQANAS